MKKRVILYVLVLVLLIPIIILTIRLFSARQLDDVTPEILCDDYLLNKADILFIIPKFNNKSIAENPEWCNRIKNLNKTLAIHGVYHTYNEFKTDRDFQYLDEGMRIFENCFNMPPSEFKSPQLNITKNNIKLIKKYLKFDGIMNQIFHKAYHCSDSGKLKNRFIDWV